MGRTRRYLMAVALGCAFLAAAAGAGFSQDVQEGTVAVHMLNLRSGPGTSHSVLGVLGKGARVEILDRENGWLRVFADGRTGYVKDDPSYVHTGLEALSGGPAGAEASPFADLDVRLAKGEQRVVSVLGASRFTLGAEGVVRVRFISADEVLLVGMEQGVTDLIFWDGDRKVGAIKVQVSLPLELLARNMRHLMSGMENVTVSVVGDKIVLDGRLLTMQDLERVKNLAASFGQGQILNLTTLDRGEENIVVERFIQKTSGLDTVEIKILGDTAFLKGMIFSEGQRKQLTDVAKTQVEKVVDLLELREIMIDTDVMFLQVEKDESSGFGSNLFDGLGGGNAATFTYSGSGTQGGFGTWAITASFTANLMKFLEIEVSEGRARMIQRPHISTKSGEKGYFHSGGEFYFEVSGVQAATLQDVEYGLQLTITPVFRTRDEIVCTVRIEISVPVASSGSEVLNLDKFVTENTVLCKMGQSIVISGIIQKIRNHYKGRTPLLGDIPILNLFFGSRTTNDTDKELVAILTPRIMNLPEISPEAVSESHTKELLELAP